jgi:site-specific recombinase XerD
VIAPVAEDSTDALLAPTPTLPAARNPAIVYIASLGSAQSRASMEASLRIIARIIGGDGADPVAIPWHLLRHEHTAAIRSKLTSRLDGEARSPASLHRHVQALRGVLRACWRLGYLTQDELARAVAVERVRGERLPAGKAVTDEEVARLVAACDATRLGLRNRAALALLFGGGLRRSEAVSAKVEHYDRTRRTIRIIGKGNVQRDVPLGASAELLGPWLAARGSGPGPILQRVLKNGRVAGPLTTSGLYDALKVLGADAGVDFSPHDARHTRITGLLAGGADIALAQRFAGHKDVKTTVRYDNRGSDAVAAAAEKIIPGGLDGSPAAKKI